LNRIRSTIVSYLPSATYVDITGVRSHPARLPAVAFGAGKFILGSFDLDPHALLPSRLLVSRALQCYCPPARSNDVHSAAARAAQSMRSRTASGRVASATLIPTATPIPTGSVTTVDEKSTGADLTGARGQHESAVPEGAAAAGSRSRILDDFAAYRMMQRRIEDAAQRGIMLPFFQPRDGVSGGTIRWNGQDLVNYSGYNYLGLSGHPSVSEAAKQAIDRYGTSASASRIVSGEIELHGVLERRLATFLGTEDCLVFISGYLTNLTVIGHLFSRPDVIVHDAMAHNSIITGCRLSEARTLSFPHENWPALDEIMAPVRPTARRGLLVTEGIYSMDGDIIDIDRAIAAKHRHDLLLMVDEAHSFGIIGNTGRGVCERAGVPASSIDIHMGTLSKTLASCGGYIAGDQSLIDYLRYTAPGFLFSVGLSPADTAAALAALDVLEIEPERPGQLQENARLFRRLARKVGLDVGGAEESPVVPLILRNSELCVRLSLALLELGVNVQPIIYPAVAEDAARLRFFITHNHTEAQFAATLPLVARELERLHAMVA
jgi:8-amino-7-oxononanoate synthase